MGFRLDSTSSSPKGRDTMICAITLFVCGMGDYQWKPVEGNTQCVTLCMDGVEVGSYCLRTGRYSKLSEDGTLVPDNSPIGIPEEYAKKAREETGNYGLDWTKIGSRELFKLNGKEVSKEKVYGVFDANKELNDDSKHLRLTVIGPEKDRNDLLAEIKKNKGFEGIEKESLVQSYPKDHWALTGKGFDIAPKGATVYLQLPNGEVVYSGSNSQEMFDSLRKLRSPSGPLDIKWNSLSLGFNPFTWMVGLGWSSFKVPGELILLVLALIFAFVILKRSV